MTWKATLKKNSYPINWDGGEQGGGLVEEVEILL